MDTGIPARDAEFEVQQTEFEQTDKQEKHIMYISKWIAFGWITTGLLFSDAVVAYDLNYELRAGIGHSDNITRTDINPIDETLGIAGIRLDLSHVTAGIDFSVLGDVEYRDYLDDVFDNDTFGSIDTDLILTVSPRLMTWTVENRFGHVVLDPFAPETPRTRERVNRISTGPNITIPFGNANSLGISGRYSSNSFSDTDVDNDTLDGRLSFVRALSSARSVSLNVTASRVDFDNQIRNSSFDQQSAFVEFESQNSKGSITARVGVNELHDAGVTQDGNLFELTLARQLSSRTSIEFLASQELTFIGELFNNRQGPGQLFQNTQTFVGVGDPLEIQRFEGIVRLNSNASNWSASIASQSEEFVNQFLLDRSLLTVRVSGGLQLGSAWQLNFSAGAINREYDDNPREDDDLVMTVGASRQFPRNFSLSFDVSRVERNSNQAGASYDETVAYLTVRYSR